MRKYQQYVLRPGTGRTVPQASILVKSYPSTEVSPNAIVYSDDGALDEVAQPFLATSSGHIEFYAPDGRYDIYVTYADIAYTLIDVWIFDPNTPISGLSNLQGCGFVTTRAEGLLSSETVIPTFLGHPDSLPIIAHAQTNEFSAADGNWANFNANGNSVISIADSRLHIFQSVTQRIAPAVGFERTSFTPDTDFTLTAQLRFGYHPGLSGGEIGAERPFWGLGIKDNLGNIAAIGLRGGSQGLSVYKVNFDSSSISSSEGFQTIGSNACYVRVRKLSGGNYFFDWSQDGFTWITVKSEASLLAGTIVRFGLYAYAPFDTGGLVDCYSDFVRYIATVPY